MPALGGAGNVTLGRLRGGGGARTAASTASSTAAEAALVKVTLLSRLCGS